MITYIEEEFRSQNSGAEPETLRLRSESISGGFKPATFLLTTKSSLSETLRERFSGGAKTPFIHPPVTQNSILNSGS
ncbi:hypothetical protein [Nostoc sp. CHAB 5715]|uniref:hypothetical protein n=1 Tax=Nostoc sp. CHAB 5715 TaxID=2780400 RepID=UPI001E37227D|nr:hypothetical protein [Nostoc sp. CHAB 5715]MCC5619796.1 hypothetical protein [Nostoc sp. CHAB 5715]